MAFNPITEYPFVLQVSIDYLQGEGGMNLESEEKGNYCNDISGSNAYCYNGDRKLLCRAENHYRKDSESCGEINRGAGAVPVS